MTRHLDAFDLTNPPILTRPTHFLKQMVNKTLIPRARKRMTPQTGPISHTCTVLSRAPRPQLDLLKRRLIKLRAMATTVSAFSSSNHAARSDPAHPRPVANSCPPTEKDHACLRWPRALQRCIEGHDIIRRKSLLIRVLERAPSQEARRVWREMSAPCTLVHVFSDERSAKAQTTTPNESASRYLDSATENMCSK